MSEQPCSVLRAQSFLLCSTGFSVLLSQGRLPRVWGGCHRASRLCRGRHPEVKRRSFESTALLSQLTKIVSHTHFFLNLSVAKRMDLSRLTNWDSRLRWQKAVCHPTWARDWPEKGNQCLSPQGNWEYFPWSVVRYDKQERRLIADCPYTIFGNLIKVLAFFKPVSSPIKWGFFSSSWLIQLTYVRCLVPCFYILSAQ